MTDEEKMLAFQLGQIMGKLSKLKPSDELTLVYRSLLSTLPPELVWQHAIKTRTDGTEDGTEQQSIQNAGGDILHLLVGRYGMNWEQTLFLFGVLARALTNDAPGDAFAVERAARKAFEAGFEQEAELSGERARPH